MITQKFDLNLIPDSAPIVVHVDQYDKGSRRLVMSLYAGNSAYTPATRATAIIQGTKPDGKGFDYSCTISGNIVTADVTEQMTAVAGRVRCQLVVTESSNRTGTFVFWLEVQKSALPADTDMSESEYQMVMDLIHKAEAINDNPPKIGTNGNWWVWSSEQEAYIDSGVDASITVSIADVTMLDPDASPYVTNTGTDTDPVFHLYIPRGKGISKIAKTGTSGLVDTYTITYSDGATYSFMVTNGAKGDTGAAAGFGTPTATVDGNVGTPSVSVSASGPDTAKVFNFSFKNLKGQPGKTAYESAVSGGYSGSEAEFYQILADFEQLAKDTEDAADRAEAIADELKEDTDAIELIKSYTGSEAILDSDGNIILDSDDNPILDSTSGAAKLIHTIDNIVTFLKANANHIIYDSGYTESVALYEIVNS